MVATDPRRPRMTDPQDDLRELQAALEERDSRPRVVARPLRIVFCTVDRELRVTSAWGSAFETADVDPDSFVGVDVHELFETGAGVVAVARPGEVGTLKAGEITIDPFRQTAKRGGRTLDLSPTEFRLLTEFVREQGRVLSRDHLLRTVWGYHFIGRSRLVDMAVKRLRDKLECPGEGGGPISTVRGIGYRLEA